MAIWLQIYYLWRRTILNTGLPPQIGPLPMLIQTAYEGRPDPVVGLAGGYTYRAQQNELLITKANDAEKKRTPADHKTVVLPGDVIEVPEPF